MAVTAEMLGAAIQLQSPEPQKESCLEETNMVQVFMVVRCYSCKTFQVQQVKKTNKWLCKVCNEKQSVVKTYGKGTGKDCRRHVQKLNMLRRAKNKEADSSYCSEQHPPQDYASTFTAQEGDTDTLDVLEHPVVLGNTKTSRWTAFTSPNEEDEDETVDHTSDREVAASASKSRLITRRVSDRVVSHKDSAQNGELCPYSSVNYEANFQAIPSSTSIATPSSLSSSKSMYFYPDRYTKLEEACAPPPIQSPFSKGIPTNTQSMYNLTTPTSSASHKERMEKIKQDLQKFSTDKDRKCKPKVGVGGHGRSIPKLSSRWSQFMCEDDSNSDDEGSARQTEHLRTTSNHILASKSTIAKYTFDAIS